MFLVFEQAKVFQFNSSITTLNMWEPRALGGKIIKICRISGRFPEFEIALKIKERKKSFIIFPTPHTHTHPGGNVQTSRPPPEKTCSIFFSPPHPLKSGFQDPYQPKFGIFSIFQARASPATGILTFSSKVFGKPPPPRL